MRDGATKPSGRAPRRRVAIGIGVAIAGLAWWWPSPRPAPKSAPEPARRAEPVARGPSRPTNARRLLQDVTWPEESAPGLPPAAPKSPDVPAPPDPVEGAPQDDEESLRAAEISNIQRARSALEAGEHETASELFASYLAEYPGGEFSDDAVVGQLEAWTALGRTDDVLRFAERTLHEPDFETRRPRVLVLLATAEAADGRCVQASATLERAIRLGALVGAEEERARMQACDAPQPP